MPRRHTRPISTYRLQFNAAFRYDDARALLPYLEALGVTDCYSSPILRPAPGSSHGYDTCDHARLNAEPGSEEAYGAWCAALRDAGFGHVVDVVPNHMSSDPMANPWWRDVLENGPSSPYGRFFDVDWNPIKSELKDKVLLPLLGDQYGRVLERGELQLQFEDGALHLRYFDRDLPVNPRQSPRVLRLGLDDLERQHPDDPAVREFLSILTALANLPPYTEPEPERIIERQREKEVSRERLARLVAKAPAIAEHIDACVRAANGVVGDRASFDRLHELLEHQAYRLAYWRTAVDEINYRRFFDINELIGLRMEDPAVFEATHRRLIELIAAGDVSGLRIDHPDGLFDPGQYFERLQASASAARPDAPGAPFYVVAEKVLSAGESLRADWRVSGTTGYSFLNSVCGLFIDGRQVPRLKRAYARLTGQHAPFEEIVYTSKRTIMLTAMASELNVLADALNRISERDRRHRDFTLDSCRSVLLEVIACFPVYRTYVSTRGVDAFDTAAVRDAITHARRRNPVMEPSIFEFLEGILLPDDPQADDPVAEERLRFTAKMQQYTGPVHAKGVEDTAFYRYYALSSANDVGGHPNRLGVTPERFHEENQRRLQSWPDEMITTATHDTKRGEDTRMRINVLSEAPDAWRRAVSEWMQINARHRSKVAGNWAPDRNDEYLFYQTLIGIWPVPGAARPALANAAAALVERLRAYMQKALREAKVHTSWINEDHAYSEAMNRFLDGALTGLTAPRFLRSFDEFQQRVARAGVVNSLAQLVLKLSTPGVADVYQGNELWDLRLVDPDNRRPVDFARRQHLLAQLMPLLESIEAGVACAAEVRSLVEQWEDARVKLLVTAAALRFRRRHSEVVRDGTYRPIAIDGPAADHIVAFAREHASGTLIAAVPRLVVALAPEADPLTLGAEVWHGTGLRLPDTAPDAYTHLLTGETLTVDAEGGARRLQATALFGTIPVALLWAPAGS